MLTLIPKQRLMVMSLPFLKATSLQITRQYKDANPGEFASHNLQKYHKPEFIDDEWITIYKFPYISAVASASKTKTLQYLSSLVGCPAVYGLEYFAIIPQGWFDVSLMIALSGCVTFTAVGQLSKNLVGFAYVNPDHDLLRLGYLNFWGQREDTVVKVDNVRHLSEIQKFKCNPMSRVELYDSKKRFKIFEKIGVIKRDLFELVFGHTHT